MTYSEIIDCIPYGHENAIQRRELVRRTGEKDRVVRDAIACSEELVINMQDGRGYFKPLPEEADLVAIWMNLFRSRIREEEKRIQQAQEWRAAV